jgi:hypothetical protein
MNQITKILMERDGMTFDEANELVEEAKHAVRFEDADSEEVLSDWFGLEADYIFDLM